MKHSLPCLINGHLAFPSRDAFGYFCGTCKRPLYLRYTPNAAWPHTWEVDLSKDNNETTKQKE